MKMNDAYQQKMAAQMKEWNAQIDLLEAKLGNAGADLKLKQAGELRELRAKQRIASEKMQELGKASGEAWVQIKVTADKIWDELRTGLADAHSKFK
jgi:outer membrane murein-binding lipoprotein Lpp